MKTTLKKYTRYTITLDLDHDELRVLSMALTYGHIKVDYEASTEKISMDQISTIDKLAADLEELLSGTS